jgi:DNA-binding NarL/FixJ family response regulator
VLMATKDETPFRESLTRLTDLGPIAAARLVRRPMRELDIGEFPPAYAAGARKHLRGLTNCEQEILDLVSDGLSNEVIAATLFISVRIVEHHVCAIPNNRRASTRADCQGGDQAGLDAFGPLVGGLQSRCDGQ